MSLHLIDIIAAIFFDRMYLQLISLELDNPDREPQAMRKILSVPENPKTSKKSVRFSEEVDLDEIERRNKRIYEQIHKTVIELLYESIPYRVKDESKANALIDEARGIVEEKFEKYSDGYKRLMPKCCYQKALNLPLGEEREMLIALAHMLDPTREKIMLR